MATLRALAFSAFILSVVAACAAPQIPEQIAGEPGVAVTADAN